MPLRWHAHVRAQHWPCSSRQPSPWSNSSRSLSTSASIGLRTTFKLTHALSCPCFEDAVAFVAVSLGLAISTPGYYSHAWTAAYPIFSTNERTQQALVFLIGAVRLVLGTGIVGVWRICAKKVLHAILPPIFRFAAPVIELPRRHYRKASDYISYQGKEADVKPVPSLFDLSNLPDATASAATVLVNGQVPERTDGPPLPRVTRTRSASESLRKAFTPSTVHYDADVLTKLIVYCATGAISSLRYTLSRPIHSRDRLGCMLRRPAALRRHRYLAVTAGPGGRRSMLCTRVQHRLRCAHDA
jgi:hypothetical protein